MEVASPNNEHHSQKSRFCPVCLTTIASCDGCWFPCTHQFCISCLYSWFKRGKRTCPLCRLHSELSDIVFEDHGRYKLLRSSAKGLNDWYEENPPMNLFEIASGWVDVQTYVSGDDSQTSESSDSEDEILESGSPYRGFCFMTAVDGYNVMADHDDRSADLSDLVKQLESENGVSAQQRVPPQHAWNPNRVRHMYHWLRSDNPSAEQLDHRKTFLKKYWTDPMFHPFKTIQQATKSVREHTDRVLLRLSGTLPGFVTATRWDGGPRHIRYNCNDVMFLGSLSDSYADLLAPGKVLEGYTPQII